ncbi:BMC domain-containing protein [Cohnella caldifontis]|uniref:BMC domain-containing protein n=1 Tax=Cohnella caldifontis TaxID=3027471 RepID=UPI0023EBF3D0|nr:BMC domain-containing protein [Cohnella sp. YIM B05605]
MEQQALGLIETIGYATAVSAADAALKAANVKLVAMERIIGVGGMLGVTIHLGGEVAAVASAVEAGKEEAGRVGTLVSAHVIPRAHDEVGSKVLSRFRGLETVPLKEEAPAKPQAAVRSGKNKPASPAPENAGPTEGI